MKLGEKVARIAGSAHTGRAVRVVKVLNFASTVRGAITTVLLVASAIGGAATVNDLRHDLSARTSPTASPVTRAGLRADAQRKLLTALGADIQAADDLRKVAVIAGPRLDQLIADTKQKLEARYDQGLAQIDALLGPASPTPNPLASALPEGSPNAISAAALVQVIVNDLNVILVQATRAATEPTPTPAPPTVPPRTSPPLFTLRPTPTPTVRPTK